MHLETLEKSQNRTFERLHRECPKHFRYLWEIYGQLMITQAGLNPISYSEIKAWSDLTGIVLKPFELSILRRIERTFMGPTLRQLESKATAADKARARKELEGAKPRRG